MDNMAEEFRRIRKEYRGRPLDEEALADSPFPLFQTWFEEAVAAGLTEPNGMTLATATRDGRPSARTVLLKSFADEAFTFFTNYESRKGRELLENPQAALVFWWVELERQVRIEGRVERVSAAESDAYYTDRPRGSQVGAWASPQSQVIPSRRFLEEAQARIEAESSPDEPLVRPAHWGGYRLIPEVVEFWQGRPDRLHDRMRYRADPDGRWQRERLAP